MRVLAPHAGASGTRIPCRQVALPRTILATVRPGVSRSRRAIKPQAMFSRYDPFGVWPPYRTNSSSSSSSSGSGSNGGWGGSSGSRHMSGEQRLAAATPAQRQAMLSTVISGVSDWQQLWSIVERYGRYLTANNVTHALTKLEQVVRGQQYMPAEAAQIEDLLEWLLQRGRELNATAQLGPQGLGATAGAVSRLQQAQRQQQQQQQQLAAQQQAALRQQQQQQQQEEEEAAARQLRQQQAAEVERDQLMRELVDAAVSQKHRLSRQALNNLLSALADIEESNMSADEIRQLLNIPNKKASRAAASPPAGAATMPNPMQTQALQQQQQQVGRQQQQQQQQAMSVSDTASGSSSSSSRSMSPGSLQATARQLGQLSPELAQEWYHRALRQGLDQGYIPRGVDQSYMAGFLAREIERAAARATETSSSSSGPSGAVLLSNVVSKYGQLMGVDHLALALHKLAELQEEGVAGSEQELKAVAGSCFQQLQPLVPSADGATLSSIVHSCKDLQLYSKTLLQTCLSRAKQLLEQQLRGYVDAEGGFSGRRLSVMLHGLAVLGLRPTDEWLRLAVTAAGKLMAATCSITDLERLASALLIMRVNPGSQWTAAAEDRLEQLAAALGSSDSRRLRNTAAAAAGDESSEEDEEGTGNARRAIVACVKALALLGGQRANVWYQSILAAEEKEQQQQQQPEGQQQGEEDEEDVRQRQLQEYAQQQAALATAEQQQQQQQQQGAAVPAAGNGDKPVERQLKTAVQKQQHRGPKLHLHPHHHLQHRQPGSKQQQQQQQQQPVSQAEKEVIPLSSLDDYMDRELQQQQQQSGSKLPQPHTSLADAAAPAAAATATSPTAAAAADSSAGVEAAAPAAWAAEQTSRWAQTKGEAAQPSPAVELQQRLDDSTKLFGSSKSKLQQQQGRGKDKQKQGAGATSKQQQQQQQQQQEKVPSGGSRILPKASATRPEPQDIPIKFEDNVTSSSNSLSSSSSSTTATTDASKPSQEAQRSAAEAADALAALMAEIEGQAVAESDQEEVLKELGLTDEDASLAGSRAQAAELQEAAELVEQATKQLDDLQKKQAGPAAAAAAGGGGGVGAGQQAGSKGKQQQQQQKGQDRRHHKHQHGSTASVTASGTAGSGTPSGTKKQKNVQRALGSSGDAAFLAAAKALQGPNKPSRTLLLGCLEAIEQQQQKLRTQLAKQQVESAVAGAAQRQQAAAAAVQDPAARKLAQLKADFDRARERAAQEKSGIRATAAADVLGRLLPLLDSFEAAEAALDKLQQQQGNGADEREFEEARRVYNALHAQLLSIVKSQGARIVGANGDLVGKQFDPQEMEAVMRQPAPAGVADGDVLTVLRKGYAVGDKLVRPALVVVAYEY